MEKILNFRDFGGYQTTDGRHIKKGMLFRSAHLGRATDADLKQISELGIKTIVDLRNVQEKTNRPDLLPEQNGINYFHFPIRAIKFDKGNFLYKFLSGLVDEIFDKDYVAVTIKAYEDYATEFQKEYAALFKLLAEPKNLPLLVHCTAGKDRTGVACAMIHSILDVPSESIMQDYLVSNNNLQAYQKETLQKFEFMKKWGFTADRFMPLFDARESYLNAALNKLDKGKLSIKDYILDFFEVSENKFKSITNQLLE